MEFHGDVSFITLYADDQAQQMELVKRKSGMGPGRSSWPPVMAEEAVKELEGMNHGLPCHLSWPAP